MYSPPPPSPPPPCLSHPIYDVRMRITCHLCNWTSSRSFDYEIVSAYPDDSPHPNNPSNWECGNPACTHGLCWKNKTVSHELWWACWSCGTTNAWEWRDEIPEEEKGNDKWIEAVAAGIRDMGLAGSAERGGEEESRSGSGRKRLWGDPVKCTSCGYRRDAACLWVWKNEMWHQFDKPEGEEDEEGAEKEEKTPSQGPGDGEADGRSEEDLGR